MSLADSSLRCIRRPHALRLLWTLATVTSIGLATSCSSGNSRPSTPAETQVTLVFTGTANDQLVQFDLSLQNFTLNSKSGNTVTLISSQQGTEFIHVNGGVEPLLTVTIPQDVYTSASATIGGAEFTCIQLAGGSLATSTYAYGQTPQSNVTVNLPSPITITITGNSMGLLLNLLVSQSAAYSACYDPNANVSYAISPTFNLTPYIFASQPANPANGKALGFNGQVSSIQSPSASFTLSFPEFENTRTVSVNSTSNTEYQGITGFSALTTGYFLNMDLAIQPDGSLSATRVAVEDPTATSVVTGPLLFVSDAEPAIFYFARQEQGALYSDSFVGGAQAFSFGNATFQISGQLPNLQDLPFTPSFTGSNMVAGQNLYLTTSSDTVSGYVPLSTVTLIPQAIDGTVLASSTNGNFTVYSVQLAPYDLFPSLAVQAGQTTLLNNPAEVEVYVDSSTQLLSTQPLAADGIFRFYGLVFNDNGALRMDCAQVNDGVSLTPSQNSSLAIRMQEGQAKVVRTEILGPLRASSRLVTPAQ